MARGTSKGDIGPNAIVVERALIKEEIDNIVEIVRGFEDELKGFNYQEFKDAPTDVQVTKRPGYTREVGLKNVFMNVLDMGNKRDRKMLKEMVMHDVIKAVGQRGKMTFDGISKGPDEALPTLTFTLTASEADAERVAADAVKAIKAFQVKENNMPQEFHGEVLVRDKRGKQLVIRNS
jgi:hypothetical protein